MDLTIHLKHHHFQNDGVVEDYINIIMLLPLGDSETLGPRTSEARDPSPGGLSSKIDDDHRKIIQSCLCRKGKSHIKSKGENQLAADDFEALFEISK